MEPLKQFKSVSSLFPSPGLVGMGLSPDAKVIFTCGCNGALNAVDSLTGETIESFVCAAEAINLVVKPQLPRNSSSDSDVQYSVLLCNDQYEVNQVEISGAAPSIDLELGLTLLKVEHMPRDIDVSSDGKMIAVASEDSNIYIAEISPSSNGGTVGLPIKLNGHSTGLRSVKFDPKLEYIADAGMDGQVFVWKLDKELGPPFSVVCHRYQAMPREDATDLNSKEYEIAWSPDGSFLALSGAADPVLLARDTWDPTYLTPVDKSKGHAGNIKCVCFSPNGRYLATYALDRTIIVWDAQEQEPVRRFQLPEGEDGCVRILWDPRLDETDEKEDGNRGKGGEKGGKGGQKKEGEDRAGSGNALLWCSRRGQMGRIASVVPPSLIAQAPPYGNLPPHKSTAKPATKPAAEAEAAHAKRVKFGASTVAGAATVIQAPKASGWGVSSPTEGKGKGKGKDKHSRLVKKKDDRANNSNDSDDEIALFDDEDKDIGNNEKKREIESTKGAKNGGLKAKTASPPSSSASASASASTSLKRRQFIDDEADESGDGDDDEITEGSDDDEMQDGRGAGKGNGNSAGTGKDAETSENGGGSGGGGIIDVTDGNGNGNGEEDEEDGDGAEWENKGRGTLSTPPQDPFMPASSPLGQYRRFLCWNKVGALVRQDDGTRQTVYVDFSDVTKRRSLRFVDHYGFVVGSLAENGAVFASACSDGFEDDRPRLADLLTRAEEEEKGLRKGGSGSGPEHSAGERSVIYFRPVHALPLNSDWTVVLPKGESAVAVAIGESWVAAATTRQYLRVLTQGGIQVWPTTYLNGPVVTMAGQGRLLFIIYHGGPPIGKSQSLWYRLVDVDTDTVLSERKLPISPGAVLTWAGFTETDMPLYMDSGGVLGCIVQGNGAATAYVYHNHASGASGQGTLASSMNALATGSGMYGGGQGAPNDWRAYPLLDTRLHHRSPGDSFWPVCSARGSLLAVTLKGGVGHPTTSPRPILSNLPLSPPILDVLGSTNGKSGAPVGGRILSLPIPVPGAANSNSWTALDYILTVLDQRHSVMSHHLTATMAPSLFSSGGLDGSKHVKTALEQAERSGRRNGRGGGDTRGRGEAGAVLSAGDGAAAELDRAVEGGLETLCLNQVALDKFLLKMMHNVLEGNFDKDGGGTGGRSNPTVAFDLGTQMQAKRAADMAIQLANQYGQTKLAQRLEQVHAAKVHQGKALSKASPVGWVGQLQHQVKQQMGEMKQQQARQIQQLRARLDRERMEPKQEPKQVQMQEEQTALSHRSTAGRASVVTPPTDGSPSGTGALGDENDLELNDKEAEEDEDAEGGQGVVQSYRKGRKFGCEEEEEEGGVLAGGSKKKLKLSPVANATGTAGNTNTGAFFSARLGGGVKQRGSDTEEVEEGENSDEELRRMAKESAERGYEVNKYRSILGKPRMPNPFAIKNNKKNSTSSSIGGGSAIEALARLSAATPSPKKKRPTNSSPAATKKPPQQQQQQQQQSLLRLLGGQLPTRVIEQRVEEGTPTGPKKYVPTFTPKLKRTSTFAREARSKFRNDRNIL